MSDNTVLSRSRGWWKAICFFGWRNIRTEKRWRDRLLLLWGRDIWFGPIPVLKLWLTVEVLERVL